VGKKSNKPLDKRILNFYEGDIETIEKFYGGKLKWSEVIRELVHVHCNKLRERASREGVMSNVGTELGEEVTLILAAGAGAGESDD
jgi:hypothetical protein